jgi:hypothetical protein
VPVSLFSAPATTLKILRTVTLSSSADRKGLYSSTISSSFFVKALPTGIEFSTE